MPWLELQLTLDAAQQPRAEAALEELGALSITLTDADADSPDETAIFEPGAGETLPWRVLTLLALFDANADRRGLLHALHDALPGLSPHRVAFREVADQDWERAWMDRFRPMQFGRRLWIYPWHVEPSDRIGPHPLPSPASEGRGAGVARSATELEDGEAAAIVRLDPGLAFGTGTHPTTALCLEWLDSLDLAGKTVIDYGCGSGVLAIAALKLGAAHAIGVDTDPQALTASRNNAERNGVTDRLRLFAPDGLPADMRCDALVANILSQPLRELAPCFAATCKPDAPLALSGILAGQEQELLERYVTCGFTELHAAQCGNWIRIAGRKS